MIGMDKSSADAVPPPTKDDRHGALNGFPLVPFLSTVAILGLLGATLAVLKLADDDSTASKPWPFLTPNVAISICALGVNTVLQYVLAEGARISWWLAAQEGATLTQLYWRWEVRSVGGVARAVLRACARRRLGRVAVGTLAVAAAAAHGVLLQRAVRFRPRVRMDGGEIGPAAIKVRVAHELRNVLSGVEAGGGAYLMSAGIASLLNDALREEAILVEDPIFLGTGARAAVDAGACPSQAECMAVVRGVGLVWTATHGRYEYTAPPAHAVTGPGTGGAGVGFLVTFGQGDLARGELFTLDVLYKGDRGCNTTGYHRRLAFAPATVSYLIDVDDGSAASRLYRASRAGTERGVLRSQRRARVWPDKFFVPPAVLSEKLAEAGIDPAARDEAGLGQLMRQATPEVGYLDRRGWGWQPPTPITDFADHLASYRGIQTAVHSAFYSHSVFRPNGTSTTYDMLGTLTQTMLQDALHGQISCKGDCQPVTVDACDVTWADPTPSILNFLGKFMFVIGLHVAQFTDIPQTTVHASKVEYGPVFMIDWRYVIAGLILPMLAIACTIPTYMGYPRLEGRQYTGSPIEFAEAFDQRGDFFQRGANAGSDTDLLGAAVPDKIQYVKTGDGGWVMRKCFYPGNENSFHSNMERWRLGGDVAPCFILVPTAGLLHKYLHKVIPVISMPSKPELHVHAVPQPTGKILDRIWKSKYQNDHTYAYTSSRAVKHCTCT
ncbi:hypothetical protein DFH27DRAFT_602842 [Peziza echinospora]|nr:hypothetical protein DFH27DRAFT_602842 [Peziza echinospora]